MGIKGRFTKEKMGHTTPADAPAYARPTCYWKRARWLKFDYETDPDSAADLLPEALTLSDPPSASLILADYPWSTVGPYKEAVLFIDALFDGKPVLYTVYLMLDRTAPILLGREYGGYPKKMGHIEFVQGEDVLAGYMEAPRGIRICSGVIRPERSMDPWPDGTTVVACGLRVIPMPGREPVVDLVQMDVVVSNMEIWSGPGNAYFTGASVLDPWHKLPIRKALASTQIVFDFELREGTILTAL
jgi:acetoacetate decarboxylase